jgi:hypothetical protein
MTKPVQPTQKFNKCPVCGKDENQVRIYRRPATLQNTPPPQRFATCEDEHRNRPLTALS